MSDASLPRAIEAWVNVDMAELGRKHGPYKRDFQRYLTRAA